MSNEGNGTTENVSSNLCKKDNCKNNASNNGGEKGKEFEEVCKNVTPKKIRELANILKVDPKELVKCLEDHPDGFIAHAVKNQFKNELQKTDHNNLTKPSSRWLEYTITISDGIIFIALIFIIVLLISICILT